MEDRWTCRISASMEAWRMPEFARCAWRTNIWGTPARVWPVRCSKLRPWLKMGCSLSAQRRALPEPAAKCDPAAPASSSADLLTSDSIAPQTNSASSRDSGLSLGAAKHGSANTPLLASPGGSQPHRRAEIAAKALAHWGDQLSHHPAPLHISFRICYLLATPAGPLLGAGMRL